MAELAVRPQPRKGLLIWMIVSQILTAGSLFIWLVMAGLSVMAFDSGVTQKAWTFVILVWSYPIIPVAIIAPCPGISRGTEATADGIAPGDSHCVVGSEHVRIYGISADTRTPPWLGA